MRNCQLTALVELSASAEAFLQNPLEPGGWYPLKCVSQGLLPHLSMTFFS